MYYTLKINQVQSLSNSDCFKWSLVAPYKCFFFRCPARECHGAFKCKGDFVDSFAIPTLEECISKCNEVEDCLWFTLEKANDHCILYEECNDQFDCETCATGERKCANGYKGKYECLELDDNDQWTRSRYHTSGPNRSHGPQVLLEWWYKSAWVGLWCRLGDVRRTLYGYWY